MFETGPQSEYGRRYRGRRWRRRGRWYGGGGGDDDDYETGLYGEAAGNGEYGYAPSGEFEEEYGYAPSGEFEGGEFENGEFEDGEFEDAEGEEQFLPLIPLAGKVLGGLLGGLVRESESMYEGEYPQGESADAEAGEAEEQFLGKLLSKVLGKEAEYGGAPIPPAQEAELAAQMLEISDEGEMDEFLSRIVNTIGRAVQGISGAANSPQGRALIEAVKPLARAALPVAGGPAGAAASTVLELETYEMEGEEQEFETARRVVRLTAAAAQDAASAPPGAPPQMVGELSVIRAARQVARPLFRRALRAISPLARRYHAGRIAPYRRYGGVWRYGGYRPPYRYGRWAGPRAYWPRYRRYGYGPAYVGAPGAEEPPPPPPEEPVLPPARPGYRWVAVPIGAPPPVAAPPPAPEPPPGPEAPPQGGAPPTQSEFGRYGRRRNIGGPSGRWVRRAGKIILLDV